MTISDENHLTPQGNMLCNSVLKTTSQVTEAKLRLKGLKLFLPHDTIKAWDTYKIIEIINNADRESFILDVGCNDSPVLPMLKRLGFRNLYGCDLVLRPKYKYNFMNTAYSFYKRDYKPIVDMLDDKSLKLSIQNLEATHYIENTFDFVTSLSVIEHGVDIQKVLRGNEQDSQKRWFTADIYRLLARKNYQHKMRSLKRNSRQNL